MLIQSQRRVVVLDALPLDAEEIPHDPPEDLQHLKQEHKRHARRVPLHFEERERERERERRRRRRL